MSSGDRHGRFRRTRADINPVKTSPVHFFDRQEDGEQLQSFVCFLDLGFGRAREQQSDEVLRANRGEGNGQVGESGSSTPRLTVAGYQRSGGRRLG